MLKRIFRMLSLILLTTFMLSGCLKNGFSTVALPEIGTAASVIPAEIRSEFESRMTIHEGVNPPDITSSFVIAPNRLSYSSDGITDSEMLWADSYMCFYNRNGNTSQYKGKQSNSEESSSYVVVIGEGADFTAYYTSKTTYNDGVTWVTTTNLTSGTITPNGIKDVRHAFIVVDKNDPNSIVMGVSEYRVFYDGDGMAEFTEWSATKALEELDGSCGKESIMAGIK